MFDVRLTATNPQDSSVVLVACNEKGELKLEEPIAPPAFDGNLDGDLTVSGSAEFASDISTESAEFAGGKAGFTAEGYFWCTTRRGETVILDATSQGMGIWQSYTPARDANKDEIESVMDIDKPRQTRD